MLERQIQKSILDYLATQRDVYFFRSGAGAFKTEDGRYFKTGKKGCPDIVASVCGVFTGFEVKTKKGQQSDNQKDAEMKIRKTGGVYAVVRSVDEVEKIISIIRREVKKYACQKNVTS